MHVASVVAIVVASWLVASSESAKLNSFFDHEDNRKPFLSVHNQGTQRLPDGFVSGQRFVPPPFDPSQVGSSAHSSISFDANAVAAAAAGVEIPGCTLHTTTIEVTETVRHPVSRISLITSTETQYIPTVLSQFIVSTRFLTLTNYRERIELYTEYSSIRQQIVQTRFPEAVTVTSTFTRIATAVVNSVITRTLSDTVISTATRYLTTTNVNFSTSTVIVSVTITSYTSLPASVVNLVQTATVTHTFDNYLPPQISYIRSTVLSTEIVSRTQRLNRETIATSTTIYRPIYTTITTTSVGTRTRSVWSTYEHVRTKTVTDISTFVRVGVARQTEFIEFTSTQTQIQYFTTSSPVYITTSVTRDIAITTTRRTTVLNPEYVISTLPGQLITDVVTRSSLVRLVTTVTNTLTTPVVYVTQTQFQNCPTHVDTFQKLQTQIN